MSEQRFIATILFKDGTTLQQSFQRIALDIPSRELRMDTEDDNMEMHVKTNLEHISVLNIMPSEKYLPTILVQNDNRLCQRYPDQIFWNEAEPLMMPFTYKNADPSQKHYALPDYKEIIVGPSDWPAYD